MKRARKSEKAAVTTVRPEYSISPDDDLYGSPRSWMGVSMTQGGGAEVPSSHANPAVDNADAPENLPEQAQELARYYKDRKAHESWLGSPVQDGKETESRRGGRGSGRPGGAHHGFSTGTVRTPSRSSTTALQVIGAFGLLVASFLVFHSNRPLALRAQQELRAMFKVDYTSIDLPASVARVFGSLPSSGSAAVPAAVTPLDFVTPLKGSIVRAFSVVSPEVVISGRPGSPVAAAADGLVDNVGESQANGYYVTIDHGSFGQTLYAHLGRLTVHQHEYVVAGQTIGYLPRSDGHLTFGYIKGGSYRNPRPLLDAAK